jgi:DNA-directed RNA polymerase subunit K/omega
MERLTKYELARMIGSRALQIAMGAPFMVKMTDEDLVKIGYNPIEIAKKELAADVLPLTVRRAKPVIKQVGTEKNKTDKADKVKADKKAAEKATESKE